MVFSAVCLKHSHDIPECRAPLMAKDTDKALVRYYKERGRGVVTSYIGIFGKEWVDGPPSMKM